MAHNNSQVLITCSTEFKDALGEYAAKQKTSIAWVVREAVAKMIGYDFSKEQITDGRKKYSSVEERKEAQAKRQREQNATVKKLLELYKHEQHLHNIKIIEDSLNRKGH